MAGGVLLECIQMHICPEEWKPEMIAEMEWDLEAEPLPFSWRVHRVRIRSLSLKLAKEETGFIEDFW